MKRNETVLVYAVTALLLVILLVAVLFGSQPANAGGGDASKKTAQLPGVMKALTGDDDPNPTGGPGTGEENPENTGGTSQDGDQGNGGNIPGTAPGGPVDPKVGADTGNAGTDTDTGSAGGPIVPANVKPGSPNGTGPGTAVPLNARVDLPAQRLERMFGTSERQGNYRLVKAWDGATLHQVVERWCGSTDTVDDVRSLNESLGASLRSGDEVLVPWVDAETLLTAHETLTAERKKIDWAKGELYKMKKGDSLWKLASRRVATNKIPSWLEQFKALNPEISNLDALVEGQSVRLPR